MLRLDRKRAALAPVLFALVLACGAGCGSPGPKGPQHAEAKGNKVNLADVSDADFPATFQKALLAAPGSKERDAAVSAVFRKQLVRARSMFRSRREERATNQLVGAFTFVRTGEVRRAWFGPEQLDAVQLAAKEFSKDGDEGRSAAMFGVLQNVGDDAAKSDAQFHLSAIDVWLKGQGGGASILGAGAVARAKLARVVLEPSNDSRTEAARAAREWIEQAVQLRAKYRARTVTLTREEGVDALYAIDRGSLLLVAACLRDGDPKVPLSELKKFEKVDDVVKPELLRALEQVSDKSTSKRWIKVAQLLMSPQGARDDEAEGQILRFGALHAMLEAYRLERDAPEIAGYLSTALLDLGLGEVAPLVLQEAALASNDPRFIAGAMAVILRALADQTEVDDSPAARRVFEASRPILAYVESAELAYKAQPGPGQIYAVMGEVELREGNVKEAREYLEKSSAMVPLGPVTLLLARIDWQQQDGKRAVARVREALEKTEVTRDPLLRGELLAFLGEVLRGQKDLPGARKELTDAVKALAPARRAEDAPTRARAERVTARILDRFGAVVPAARALDRALDASRDNRQAAATVGQQIARALVFGDLRGAREAFRRALALEVEDIDLVYYAMWVRLLERQAKAAPDASIDRVFAQTKADSRWIGRVSAFGAGQLSAADFVKQAATPSQKTEAQFYVAMDRRARGDSGALEELRRVSDAGSIELMEVAIAKDLVTSSLRVPGPVPEVP